MGKIQEVAENEEVVHARNLFLKIWEDQKTQWSSATNQVTQFTKWATLSCTTWDRYPFMLEALAGGIDLLFLWRLSSTWWRNNKKGRSQFPSFDSPLLPCTSESLKGQETRRVSVVTKTIGKQWMPEEEHGNTTRGTIVIRWQEDETCKPTDGQIKYCRYLGYFTTIDISYTAPWHQRHRYESTITLVCNDEKCQAGPMKARKDFKLRKFSHVFDKKKDDSILLFRRTREWGKDHSMKHCEQS